MALVRDLVGTLIAEALLILYSLLGMLCDTFNFAENKAFDLAFNYVWHIYIWGVHLDE